MMSFACRDMGMDCDEVITGETKEEVMMKAKEHAMSVHSMTEDQMTPEMMEKMEAACKEAM